MFDLVSPFQPIDAQRNAVAKLVSGIENNALHQVLLGVTGSGKTFTLANVIQKTQRPTLVISHNKTLANQLFEEFKDFFPNNAVHYFVSYYDYYQPEAYIASSDTYIEKDVKINDAIEQMRHAATADLLSRDDVIIVASVSCIYSLGDPQEYENLSLTLAQGQKTKRDAVLKHLVELQYRRNDIDPKNGEFRASGNRIEIILPHGTVKIGVTLDADTVTHITQTPLQFKLPDPRDTKYRTDTVRIFPAKLFVAPQDKLKRAIADIRQELKERATYFHTHKKFVEEERILFRTRQDIAMMLETGYCSGIENYSRHLSGKRPGDPPSTLIDYFTYRFGNAWQCFIDESHMTIPQVRGMHAGDRARKESLIQYGFRLPSAIDNRPLMFSEFTERLPQTVYVSATPAPWERDKAGANHTVEQLIRPTGILDPVITIHKTEKQIPHLLAAVRENIKRKQKTLIITLTKRSAEDLTEFLLQQNIKTHWIHSEVKTLARPELLSDLRAGNVDVLVGVNLLREGLDLPEVSLIAVLDADKEGFLRNETSLLQIIGRASRHVDGRVILYADTLTKSIQAAVAETQRKRAIQGAYNRVHHITPRSIAKPLRVRPVQETEDPILELIAESQKPIAKSGDIGHTTASSQHALIAALSKEMKSAARDWDFEKAAKIKQYIEKIKQEQA